MTSGVWRATYCPKVDNLNSFPKALCSHTLTFFNYTWKGEDSQHNLRLQSKQGRKDFLYLQGFPDITGTPHPVLQREQSTHNLLLPDNGCLPLRLGSLWQSAAQDNVTRENQFSKASWVRNKESSDWRLLKIPLICKWGSTFWWEKTII